jgi:predicted ester cyclase
LRVPALLPSNCNQRLPEKFAAGGEGSIENFLAAKRSRSKNLYHRLRKTGRKIAFEPGETKESIHESIKGSFHISGIPEQKGSEVSRAVNTVITTWRTAFHGQNVTVEDRVTDGDKVTCRFTTRGVHEGEFMGLLPTHKPIVMTGIGIFRLKNGKIA